MQLASTTTPVPAKAKKRKPVTIDAVSHRRPGVIVIDGEAFDDETDYAVADDENPSWRSERGSLLDAVNGRPDPLKVLALARSQGFHACVEFWSCRTRGDIVQLICRGRRMEGTLKTVTDDVAAEIVRRTIEIGCVSWAAADLGIPMNRVYAAFDQQRLTPPKLTSEQRSAATKAGLEARGKAAKPNPAEPFQLAQPVQLSLFN